MLLRRTTTIAVALTAVMIVATACGGEDEPGPVAEPTTSESPTEPTEPTTTAPAWEKKYTNKQLDAYDMALRRWESYDAQSEPIWSRGKTTQAATEFFKEYFPAPVWQGYYDRLKTYEQVDVQIEGLAGVYWSKPKSISEDGRSVVIDQCVDYTTITTTQRDEPAQPVEWQLRPNLRTINLEKPKGYDWLIYGVTDATGGKARPCKP